MNRPESLRMPVSVVVCILTMSACSTNVMVPSTTTHTSVPGTAALAPEPLAAIGKFPIGWFDCPDCGSNLQGYTQKYADDGTLIVYYLGASEANGQWYVEGDIYHTGDSYCHDFDEMPATYQWHFDGEYLTMDLIEDGCTVRINSVDGKAWRLFETFPMGTYSASSGRDVLEIGDENSYTFKENGRVESVGTFSINGNEVTWETDSYCDQRDSGTATYTWHYEDGMLTFQLVGEDNCGDRVGVIDGVAYHKVGE